MAQRSSDNLIAGSVSGRTAIAEAIERLADEVACLAHKLNRIVPAANTRGNSAMKKSEFEAALRCAFAETTCEERPPETKDTNNAPFLPQHSTELNAVIADGLGGQPNANFKTSLPKARHVICPEENALAARVAELYDRFGGFIKPSLAEPPDHNA
jgi:hypothetical protein